MTLSSHQQRILTSLVLVPPIIWLLFQKDTILAAGLFIVSGLGLYEYCSMFWQGRQKRLYLSLGLVLSALITLLLGPAAGFSVPFSIPFLALPLLFLILAITFLLAYSRDPSQASFTQLALLLGGIIYLPVTLQLFRFLTSSEILFILVCSFASDTGGFYGGRFFGSTKIWPGISPKKTWAGSFGGMLSAMLCALIIGLVWGKAPWWFFLVLGLALNISAQLGDFFESALKRWADVKDSGKILPGHGGIIDRIDSLLFVLPMYCLMREVALQLFASITTLF